MRTFKWTYETVKKEAEKYTSRNDFKKGNETAYNKARKNKWLNDYTWFIQKKKTNGYWNYDTCYNVAKKYTTLTDFIKENKNVYIKAKTNGWLNDYKWLTQKKKPNHYWTYDKCLEEAKKYTTKQDFSKNSKSAYRNAIKNDWINNYTWLKDERLNIVNGKVDCVYVYEFPNYNCAYVGRTLMRRKKDRDKEHIHWEKDTVAHFAKENGIPVPLPKYLEENITLKEGVEKEKYWEEWYRNNGWTTLNKIKTGSIGGLAFGKWNRTTCRQEAKKYKSKGEFNRKSSTAYEAARRNGWLEDYTWLIQVNKPNGYWNYDTCYNVAKDCISKIDMKTKYQTAYRNAIKNGWINDYTWFLKTHDLLSQASHKHWNKGHKWTYENCRKEASKYKTRGTFKQMCPYGYQAARIHKWLDDFYNKGI